MITQGDILPCEVGNSAFRIQNDNYSDIVSGIVIKIKTNMYLKLKNAINIMN